MTRPYVLVTNDDGIESPGLIALAEALQSFCDLLIVAPWTQQTNMGRGSISHDKAGIIEKRTLEINGEKHDAFAVYGSPAQSVAHAVLELSSRKPDFCASGINYGENLGLAFTCSGTLGACFEADSLGIPSIAFSRAISMDHQRSVKFAKLCWNNEKMHIQRIFSKAINKGLPKGVRILNVNFPAQCNLSTEVRVTKQANINYGNYVYPGKRDTKSPYTISWCLNERIHKSPKNSDIYAVYFDKVISVTPLQPIMSVKSTSFYEVVSEFQTKTL